MFYFIFFHQHIIELRKNAAAMIFIAGILFGLLLTPVLRLFADCLVNSFLQEPESEQNYEDEGLGKDEVDEDEEVEEKKDRWNIESVAEHNRYRYQGQSIIFISKLWFGMFGTCICDFNQGSKGGS